MSATWLLRMAMLSFVGSACGPGGRSLGADAPATVIVAIGSEFASRMAVVSAVGPDMTSNLTPSPKVTILVEAVPIGEGFAFPSRAIAEIEAGLRLVRLNDGVEQPSTRVSYTVAEGELGGFPAIALGIAPQVELAEGWYAVTVPSRFRAGAPAAGTMFKRFDNETLAVRFRVGTGPTLQALSVCTSGTGAGSVTAFFSEEVRPLEPTNALAFTSFNAATGLSISPVGQVPALSGPATSVMSSLAYLPTVLRIEVNAGLQGHSGTLIRSLAADLHSVDAGGSPSPAAIVVETSWLSDPSVGTCHLWVP